MEHTLGLQVRYDAILDVGLHKTRKRRLVRTVRDDQVNETSLGFYYQNATQWFPKFRTVAGLRGDIFFFDVDGNNPANSGSRADSIVSPKLSLIFGPWASTEIYLNGGFSFHSNDARGTTITVDPQTGDPAARVDPLVRSKGAEIGVRSAFVPGLHTTLALWYLELDSELLFVGDAGITEPSRPSRRYGIEWTNYYRVLPWLVLEADFAFTHAEFSDDDPAGDHIPGAFETVINAGATAELPYNFFSSIRLRYFGARPLIEDDSVRSDPYTSVNLAVGYKYKQFLGQLDVINLLDAKDHDIDYFYASRLRGEPAEGVEDIHFHPIEPRTIRFSLTYKF
jgi:outer membrane receptor protein involved in Fe transport